MTKYLIDYRVVEYRIAEVEADSESAARQAFIDDDLDDDEYVSTESTEIVYVRPREEDLPTFA